MSDKIRPGGKGNSIHFIVLAHIAPVLSLYRAMYVTYFFGSSRDLAISSLYVFFPFSYRQGYFRWVLLRWIYGLYSVYESIDSSWFIPGHCGQWTIMENSWLIQAMYTWVIVILTVGEPIFYYKAIFIYGKQGCSALCGMWIKK